MIDPVQAVLLIVIILLSILLIVLGIQVFYILRELRQTIFRATKILENTEDITESVSQPLTFLSGLVFSGKSLSTLSKIIKKVKSNDGDE